MPSHARLLAALAMLAAVLVVAAGCSGGALPGVGGGSGSGVGASGEVSEGTCWSGATLGADPQDVLRLSSTYEVPYLAAAHALASRPAFAHAVDCGADHQVEVYKVVRLPDLDQQLTHYAALLRTSTPLYGTVARSVAQACMTKPLADAVAQSGLPSAVMSPMLPKGASLGWAPTAPDRWSKGERVFACTFTWDRPRATRYSVVFTQAFPTAERTCIDTHALLFVDCARKHDRERIAVIEAREAVAAGAFPGRNAIRKGPGGRYLAVGDARYQKLDAACTAYLRAISTTKKLTGVANVDVDEWPAPDDSYPIYCEADTRPDQPSLVTEGSVYDRR